MRQLDEEWCRLLKVGDKITIRYDPRAASGVAVG